jgi:hypothetical protein
VVLKKIQANKDGLIFHVRILSKYFRLRYTALLQIVLVIAAINNHPKKHIG